MAFKKTMKTSGVAKHLEILMCLGKGMDYFFCIIAINFCWKLTYIG